MRSHETSGPRHPVFDLHFGDDYVYGSDLPGKLRERLQALSHLEGIDIDSLLFSGYDASHDDRENADTIFAYTLKEWEELEAKGFQFVSPYGYMNQQIDGPDALPTIGCYNPGKLVGDLGGGYRLPDGVTQADATIAEFRIHDPAYNNLD